MEYLFGIDIGGTTVKIGFLDIAGNIIEKWEIKTDKSEKGRHILPDIADSILKFMDNKGVTGRDIYGIGFGVPGPVNKNVVLACVNLGWENVDVAKDFQLLLPFRVNIVAANDANVAAFGEVKKGGLDIHNACMFTLGTGVGGGIIVDGMPIDGSNGSAGEVGHLHIDDKHNYACNCGLTGCLETITSATGVVRLAKDYLRNDKESALNQLPNFSAKDVYELAEKGDKLCLKVTDEVAYYLGLAASIIGCTFNPDRFIIGGGMSKSGDFLLKNVEKYYQQFAFKTTKDTPFYLAKLGNDAGMVGAALLAKK